MGPIAAPMPTLETISPRADPRSPGGSIFVTEMLENAEARRRRADETPRRESEESHRESAPDAEHVSDPPVERDADGEGQQKAGDHPPHLRLRDAVVPPYNGDHDVDHGAVEHRHEDGRDHNPDQEPARDADLLGRCSLGAQATPFQRESLNTNLIISRICCIERPATLL